MTPEKERELARKGRHAALVMAGSALFFIATFWLERRYGLSNREAGLLNLFALAGFGWALWMTYGIWRQRQTDKG